MVKACSLISLMCIYTREIITTIYLMDISTIPKSSLVFLYAITPTLHSQAGYSHALMLDDMGNQEECFNLEKKFSSFICVKTLYLGCTQNTKKLSTQYFQGKS